MKTELKKELQNAQNNRPNSGFGKLSELDEKLKAVKREIYRHHDFTQTPELTAMVNEVLELAEEIDPDYHGSRRQRGKYGLLKEYRHCWKRHKEELKECPISDDSRAFLQFIPELGKLFRKSNSYKEIRYEDGMKKRIRLEEDEMTDEVKELNKRENRLDINKYARSIETKAKLFLYDNALHLIKEAKKLGLPISYGFEMEIKAVFQNEKKEIFKGKKNTKNRDREERQLALFNILLSYLGHCQVANFLINKVTENLEFTRELFEKAKAIYKESVEKFCDFLRDFSVNLSRKAQSFIMLFTNKEVNSYDANIDLDTLYMEGISLDKQQQLNYLELGSYSFRR